MNAPLDLKAFVGVFRTYLRIEPRLELVRSETLRRGSLCRLKVPMVQWTFTCPDGRGAGLLSWELLAWSVNRLLGGMGEMGPPRELSELEKSVVAPFLSRLSQLATGKPVEDLTVLRLVPTPQIKLTTLGLLWEVVVGSHLQGDLKGRIVLFIPSPQADRTSETFPLLETQPSAEGNQQPVGEEKEEYEIPAKSGELVTVQAVLGTADLTVADLVQLEAGDIVVLTSKRYDPVTVYFNGQRRALGEAGLAGGKLAVKVTKLDPAE